MITKSKSYKGVKGYSVWARRMDDGMITVEFKVGGRPFCHAHTSTTEVHSYLMDCPGNPTWGYREVARRCMERESPIESPDVDRLVDETAKAIKEVMDA